MQEVFRSDVCFIAKNFTKNYSDFLRDVWSFSKNINAQEIEIFTENTYLFVVAFFGGILSGSKVYVLPNPIPSDTRMYVTDETIYTFLDEMDGFNVDAMRLNKDADFIIQTSGSSGERKNITKTLNQMLKEAEFLCKYFSIYEDSIFFSSVLHQHLFGLTFKVFVPLLCGAKVYCENLNYPELLQEHLTYCDVDNNILILLSSPVLLESLEKQNNIEYFKRIRTIFTAGSKLSNTLRNGLSRLNTEIIEIYGSTETGVVASSRESGDFNVFDGVQVRRDTESRLIVSSPWQDCIGGFLCNDCVEISGNKLKILGRYDRIIKLHDRRIGLDGVENAIKTSPLISKVSVMQDEKYKRLSAILVLNDYGKKVFREKGKREIVKALKTILQKDYGNKLRYFYIRSNLPINAQGKIPKKDFFDSIVAKIEPEFKMLAKEKNFLRLKAYIDEGCFYFTGHFYDFPLVPGFVQLGFVFKALKNYFKIDYARITQIEAIKFITFLRPCDVLELEINIRDNKIYFKLLANTKECANGRLRIVL